MESFSIPRAHWCPSREQRVADGLASLPFPLGFLIFPPTKASGRVPLFSFFAVSFATPRVSTGVVFTSRHTRQCLCLFARFFACVCVCGFVCFSFASSIRQVNSSRSADDAVSGAAPPTSYRLASLTAKEPIPILYAGQRLGRWHQLPVDRTFRCVSQQLLPDAIPELLLLVSFFLRWCQHYSRLTLTVCMCVFRCVVLGVERGCLTARQHLSV